MGRRIEMRFLYVLLLPVLLTDFSQALQCGVSRLNNDQFRKVLTECIKDNQTFGDILSLASNMSADENGGSDSSASSDEEPPATRVFAATPRTAIQNSIKSNLKATFTPSTRARRSDNSNKQQNRNSLSNAEETAPMENQGKADGVGAAEEICILQCIFEKLQLTDSDGLPDHYKFASSLVNTGSGRETRDFLQETADECFQLVEKTDSTNSCEVSSKLTGCLAEKGRINCEDWPVGNLPF